MNDDRPWTACADKLPANGIEVETKINDSNGCRNEQNLKRGGNLWFHPDMSMYVYYTPTHWRPLALPQGFGENYGGGE